MTSDDNKKRVLVAVAAWLCAPHDEIKAQSSTDARLAASAGARRNIAWAMLCAFLCEEEAHKAAGLNVGSQMLTRDARIAELEATVRELSAVLSELPVREGYWRARCLGCGWQGSSEYLYDYEIAGTGDHVVRCRVCGSESIDEVEV